MTKLSSLHFVANRQAADRVIRMGEDPEMVFITGCPSIDLAEGIQGTMRDGSSFHIVR